MASADNRKIYRFATFEVDPDGGEVRKGGIRIRVQGKPLRLLSALLERPGTVITREELHSRLWTDQTFVDFEHGLNRSSDQAQAGTGRFRPDAPLH